MADTRMIAADIFHGGHSQTVPNRQTALEESLHARK